MKRLAFLLLVVAGCKEPAPAAPPDGAPKVAAPAKKPADAAPAAAPADAAAAGRADAAAATKVEPPPLKPSGSKVGVAVCDEYLDKMAKCMARLSPEAQVPMKNAMDDSRKAWQANAATPEGKAALDGTCRQALEAAKSAAAAMGCEW